MIQKVLVLGGGSAGFMSALALKVKIPSLEVTVVRSRDIGIIGVGEGSTTGLTRFLHQFLVVNPKKLHEQAEPIWKLGLKFLWGPRPSFNYSFGPGLDLRVEPLRKRVAYYCDENMDEAELYSALMAQDRAFPRDPSGRMAMHPNFAYHIENERFVAFLENYAAAIGVHIVEDTVDQVAHDDRGIASLIFKSGQTRVADLYVDCSGFASLLLGKTLGEPFVSFKNSLFNDRALVGGWTRDGEAIKPYTTCETMDSGWCWQIEHESRINRGYVYCSSFISDEQAEREFRAKNPKVGPTRVVRFVTGYYRSNWVKNVVAIGNASGFVEPLEATALSVIATQARLLVGALIDSDLQLRPTQAAAYSELNRRQWESIRSFIAIHFRFNTRLDTPYWRECREKCDLAGAQPFVEFYRENGPSGYWGQLQLEPFDQFGTAGYVALLTGMKVPHRAVHVPSETEKKAWAEHCRRTREAAARAYDVETALKLIRSSKWQWPEHMLGR
jgi:tryptophan halogenase